MSLTICKKCGWQISGDSAICPNCGCPKPGSTKKSSSVKSSSVIGMFILCGLVIGIGVWSKPSPSTNTNTPLASTTPTSAVELNANSTPAKTSTKQSCADIESELAAVERAQAGVEETLDATEDFGPQAGSPKRAIYMTALKRKGELQLRHIALEKKLRACGKRK